MLAIYFKATKRNVGLDSWIMECVKRNCRIDLIVFGDQKNYSSTADWSSQTSLVFLSPVLLIRMNSLTADEKPCSWSDKEESPRCFHCCALVFSKACYRPNPPLSPIISLLSPLELQKCILFRWQLNINLSEYFVNFLSQFPSFRNLVCSYSWIPLSNSYQDKLFCQQLLLDFVFLRS